MSVPMRCPATLSSVAERIEVRDNPTELRYERLVGGELSGTILYRLRPNAIALVHTDVDPRLEGHGLGAQLVAGALADIRSRGLRVIPICPFVRSYIDRHPEWQDLVAAETDVSD
jgi:uncharacterized protein